MQLSKRSKNHFDFEIKPKYLTVDELIHQAQKVTDSCFLSEQVAVSSKFFKNVVHRGLLVQKYSNEDAQRLFHVVDHMAKTRLARLRHNFRGDFVDSF
jgi:hypothetical protein